MRGVAALFSLLLHKRQGAQAVQRRQERMLRRLVLHAYTNVPYYRRLMDESRLRPQDIRTLSDLPLLPTTARKELQEQRLEEVTARHRDLSRCGRSRTSGTTGIPLEIVADAGDRVMMSPSFVSVYLEWGIRPWDRLAFIQARRELLETKSWYEWFGILPRRNLSVWENPDRWLDELRQWKPSLLQGYALTLKLFAEAINKGGRNHTVRIPLVASTSGTLDRHGRTLIESAFGARVIDIYASEEAGGVIAWQCPFCTGYHVNRQFLIVEVLTEDRPTRPGETGRVVVTNLVNYTMPFIRYEQGDLAVPAGEAGACGRGIPILAEIQGRCSDVLVLPSGERLTSHPFFMILDNVLGVAEWRIVQTELHDLRVDVNAGKDDSERVRRDIIQGLSPLVGPDMSIDVRFGAEIHRDPARKLRSIVSEVDFPGAG